MKERYQYHWYQCESECTLIHSLHHVCHNAAQKTTLCEGDFYNAVSILLELIYEVKNHMEEIHFHPS